SADAMLPVNPLACTSGAIDATVARVSRDPASCGPDSRAVGVFEYAPQGTIDCRLYAGAEGLEISMEDETATVCPYQSGDPGDGPWVLPQASRGPTQCASADPTRSPNYNILPFCRVDGARFKPLTANPNDTA